MSICGILQRIPISSYYYVKELLEGHIYQLAKKLSLSEWYSMWFVLFEIIFTHE